MFCNLLDNAYDFTKPGGQIRVRADVGRGDVRVSVEDDGIGIDPGRLGSISEKFTAEKDERLRFRGGGLGLGLGLVRQLVELHGGEVVARSDGIGRGSSFTVRLPTGSGQVGEDPLPPPEAAGEERIGGLRVLVVDDHRDAADTLAELLDSRGIDAKPVYDGEAALSLAEEFEPDAMLVDISLPGIDGYEVARRIRARDAGRRVLLVAITGRGFPDDKVRSTSAGFDRHVVKPVGIESVVALLDEVRRASSQTHEEAGPAAS